MLSYQSLVPAGAGTPRCENWMHWLMVGSDVVCAPRPSPSWGQAPALQSPLPTPLDSGLRRNDEWGAGLAKGCREWRMRGCRSGLSRIGVRDMLSYQ